MSSSNFFLICGIPLQGIEKLTILLVLNRPAIVDVSGYVKTQFLYTNSILLFNIVATFAYDLPFLSE